MSPNPLEWTDAEVVQMLRTDCAFNKARQIFSSESASIEQAEMQRRPLGPCEMRKMEFGAVRKIAAALGVDL
jgi:hypothetical protein